MSLCGFSFGHQCYAQGKLFLLCWIEESALQAPRSGLHWDVTQAGTHHAGVALVHAWEGQGFMMQRSGHSYGGQEKLSNIHVLTFSAQSV